MATEINPFGLAPKEAVDWFRAKGYAITEDWREIWQQEHASAFTVAKAAQQDLLEDLRTAVDSAIAEGITLQEFRKRLTPTLQAKGWWGITESVDPETGQTKRRELGTPRRLKTIYDTNLRQAHAAGRWERIERTKSSRPYLRYVHRFGSDPHKGARPNHQRWHDLVRPVDDPIWDHIYPMNGWGCHCKVQQLSERDLKRYDLKVSEPLELPKRAWVNKLTGQTLMVTEGVDPGFDYNVGKAKRGSGPAPVGGGTTAPKQGPEGSPPTVQDAAPAPAPNLGDPSHWYETEYKASYGTDAGRSVAYGRSVEEAGMSREWRTLHKELDTIPMVDYQRTRCKVLMARYGRQTGATTLGEMAQKLESIGQHKEARQVRAVSALVEHASRTRGAKLQVGGEIRIPDGSSEQAGQAMQRAGGFYERMSAEGVVDLRRYDLEFARRRAFCRRQSGDQNGLVMFETDEDMIHELGHNIEQTNREMYVRAREFLARRTAGETPRKLAELLHNSNFEDWEESRPDRFIDAYVGKVYSNETEVTSVGVEFVWKDPLRLAEADLDHFRFTLGQLSGGDPMWGML